MRVYKRVSRLLSVAIVASVIGVIGCNDSSYMLGENLLPDGHEMATGAISFGLDDIEDPIISARRYYSDRINVANQSNGMLGAQYDENFGTRYSGFYTQYIPLYALDEDEVFGYEPILDSVLFYFSINSWGGDTTSVIKYLVYEVLNDDFLGDYDSTDDDDYLMYDTASALEELSKDGVLSSEPLFTFTFPDQDNDVYVSTSSYVKLNDMTDAGEDLMSRLMLTSGDYTYEIYNGEYVDFVDAFKGLYITPSTETVLNTSDSSDGAIYALPFEYAGFSFYGRSKYEEDPTLVKDTIGMSFIFRDSYAEGGGTSINVVDRDFTGSGFTFEDIKTSDKSSSDVPTQSTLSVEGMGGLVSELTFEQTLFQQIAAAIEAGGEEYNNIFFNTATLSFYNTHASGYGIYTETATEYTLDDMLSRLVLYTNYSTMLNDAEDNLDTETALDYNYSYESSYSSYSTIGGSLSRSRGCYSLYIPLQMQDFWNDYTEALEENGGVEFTQDEWDEMEWNKLYLAPELTNLFTPSYSILQGQVYGENLSPIRLQITYTLLKK